MVTIKLREREVPLFYSVYEMKQIQEEIGPLGDLQYLLFGRNKDDDNDASKYGTPDHLNAVAKMVRILGNAGLEETGEAPDLTDKKVMRALRPVDLASMLNACTLAMNEGMASEIPTKETDEPVDVVLEEMNKKKEAAG